LSFNQLVTKQTDWNVRYGAEVADPKTTPERRRVLANAAARISLELHVYGVGEAWRRFPGGRRGWYGAFVEKVSRNMTELEAPDRRPWWRRYAGGGWFVAIDVGLAAALAASIALAVC
jgi:hypothetical protein